MKRIIKRIILAAGILFAALFVISAIRVAFQTPEQRAAFRAAREQAESVRAEERKREKAADAAKQAAKDTQNRIDHERFAAERQSRDFVLARLKAPSTAKFGDDAVVSDLANSTYDVRSYVDSQNAFGAMIRTNFICTLKTTDGGDHFRLVKMYTY